MAYSKCFSAQNLIWCYGNFTKKYNSDFLDIMTCDSWFFKMGKKTKMWNLRRFFSFSISNIFVELLARHIKLCIFWKNSFRSTQKCKIKSLENILSKSTGLSKWQNFENSKFGQSLEAWKTQCLKRKIGSKSWVFERIRLCLSENYYGDIKTGLFIFRKALQVMILFSTQISPFLPEN